MVRLPSPRHGLTIAETLISITLMAIILTALARTLLASLGATQDVEATLRANALHVEVLEQLQALEWDQAGTYLDDPDWLPTYDLQPAVAIDEPVGTFPSTPPAIEEIERDGRTFTIERRIVWAVEDGEVSQDTKRIISRISWNTPLFGTQETQMSVERARPASAVTTVDDPEVTEASLSPNPSTLAGDGRLEGDVVLFARFDQPVDLVLAQVPTYNPAEDRIDTTLELLTPRDGQRTTWEHTIDAGGPIFADGTFALDIAGVTLTTGATGATSIGMQTTGGPYTCLSCLEEGEAPTITISQPAGPLEVTAGETITFEGQAEDRFGTDLSDQIVWDSSRTGELGTGSTIGRTLAVGDPHMVTARVQDADGRSAEATVTVTVSPASVAPPEVEITSPADGSEHQVGTQVPLAAVATDEEGEDITAEVSWEWESDQDGTLLTVPTGDAVLSAGEHLLTVTATDTDGQSGQATVSVEVVAASQVEINSVSNNPNPVPVQGNGRLNADLEFLISVSGDLNPDSGDQVELTIPHWSSVQGQAGNQPPDRTGTVTAQQIAGGENSLWRYTIPRGDSSLLFGRGQAIDVTVTATRSDGSNDATQHTVSLS